MLTSFLIAVEFNLSKANKLEGNKKMYTLTTQEYPTSKVESREIESLSFAHKMGENGGFYKVQLVDSVTGEILVEWKA